MTTSVRYCWLCDAPVDPASVLIDKHYETGRPVFFCSPCHHGEYAWLRQL